MLSVDLAPDGMDCLLEASRQILLEAIEKQSHIDLPRTLDPNKKYSWRQRKEEPVSWRKTSRSPIKENMKCCDRDLTLGSHSSPCPAAVQ